MSGPLCSPRTFGIFQPTACRLLPPKAHFTSDSERDQSVSRPSSSVLRNLQTRRRLLSTHQNGASRSTARIVTGPSSERVFSGPSTSADDRIGGPPRSRGHSHCPAAGRLVGNAKPTLCVPGAAETYNSDVYVVLPCNV